MTASHAHRIRDVLRWLHRWIGLGTAMFLVLAGLSGCLLAFNTELERVFAPQLFARSHPAPGTPRLDLAELATRAQALMPDARVLSVTYSEPDQASVYFEPRPDPSTGRPRVLGFTDFFLDPWTGAELGRRDHGNLREGLINVMPFLYEFHWRLVAGNVGQWLMGTAALFWTCDCFIAIALTLPRPPWRGRFWSRWGEAWRMKQGVSPGRRLFDLHRAGGLWLWCLLLVFAWSSVMMNHRPVFEWVMSRISDYQPDAVLPPHPVSAPRLDWAAALRVAEPLMAEQARGHGFTQAGPQSLMYDPSANVYMYSVYGSRDLFERSPKGGGTTVTFDADTGALISLWQATGERFGNTVESWLYALHMARVFGRPYQCLVSLLGLGLAILSITGVLIWWRKRRIRPRNG
ncbi:MAG TPA: hypothetical protein DCM86_14535 [Verrucomicrobiales bacterium]|nr:hypothetical protein [Verrucomicrobiales bacterium]